MPPSFRLKPTTHVLVLTGAGVGCVQHIARTIPVNADSAENRGSFADFVQGKAGQILPTLFGNP